MAYESFRAWQARSIDQKQTASALMFGASGGALAFSVSLIDPHGAYIGCLESWIFHVQAFFHVGALTSAAAYTLNRVRDFDLTARTAREREKNQAAATLKAYRANSRRLGRISKRLYAAQTILFGLGVLTFLLFVLLHFRKALYP